MANITGIINRTSSEGVRIEVPNIGCYREVLAFDLESDNTTGTLRVRGNSTFSFCPTSKSSYSYHFTLSLLGTPSATPTMQPPAVPVFIIILFSSYSYFVES